MLPRYLNPIGTSASSDEKNEVICTVEDPIDLDEASQRLIKEELEQRYMTAIIKAG